MYRLLALLLPFLCSFLLSTADCPDGYWDCLYMDDDGHVQHSLGGFSYGRCMNYAKGKCLPCQHAMVDDPDAILAKCNALVPECLGRCSIYADLYSCCYLPSQHLPDEHQPSHLGPLRLRKPPADHRALQNRRLHAGGAQGHGAEVGRGSVALAEVGAGEGAGAPTAQLPDYGLGLGRPAGVCGNLPPGPAAKEEACGF